MEFKFDFNKEFFNNNNKENCDLSNSFINDIKNIKNENDKNIIYKNYNETKNRYIKSENIFKTSKLIKFSNKIPKSYIKINLNRNENIFKKNNFISLTLNTTTTTSSNNNNNFFNSKNKFYELDLLKKKIDEKIYKKTGKIILDFNTKNKKNNRKSNSFSIKNNNNKFFNKSFIQPSMNFNKENYSKIKSKKIINFYNLINNNNI